MTCPRRVSRVGCHSRERGWGSCRAGRGTVIVLQRSHLGTSSLPRLQRLGEGKEHRENLWG